MAPRIRVSKQACLLAASLLAVVLCGCAVALEGAEEEAVTEFGAHEGSALAPAAEGGGLLGALRRALTPAELEVASDGSLILHYGNDDFQFSVNWPAKVISDSRSGVPVASIESGGSLLYRIYPAGTHDLLAEIVSTHLLRPSFVFQGPTMHSAYLGTLGTDVSFHILNAKGGWFEVELSSGVTGWAFAPLVSSRVVRNSFLQTQSFDYTTDPPERRYIDQTSEAAAQVWSDIYAVQQDITSVLARRQ